MKILSVDDDELILELLVASLAEHGFADVVPVQSAQAALDLIQALDGDPDDQDTGVFDCFLLDIQMPGMDGIELCRRIRSMPAYQHTPILMVTTLSDRKHIEEAFAAGATDYINKPFDEIEVGARIRLANMLVNEQRRGLQAYFLASSLSSGSDRTALFQAPVVVEGVDKVVDVLVLENFLLRLSKKGLHQSAAIAFKYFAAQDAFENLPEEQYYERLETVAAIISKSFGETKFLLSHFGCGIFVAVIDRTSAPVPHNIGQIISEGAAKAEIEAGETWPAIVVGDMVEIPIARKDDFHSMLLDATASVAKKSYQLGDKATKSALTETKALKYNIFSES